MSSVQVLYPPKVHHSVLSPGFPKDELVQGKCGRRRAAACVILGDFPPGCAAVHERGQCVDIACSGLFLAANAK